MTVLFFTWIALCVAQDLKVRRIANALNVGGLVGVLMFQAFAVRGAGLFHAVEPGALGLAAGLLGGAAMLALGLLLWRMRVFGAGDAKMLVVIGALLGPGGVLPVLLLTLCAGGALALGGMVWRRWSAGTPHSTAAPPDKAALILPYSLAIMAGTLGYVAVVRWGLWGQ